MNINNIKSFLESFSDNDSSILIDTLQSGFSQLFEPSSSNVYEIPPIKGKRKVKTNIPPSKRTFKNMPRYSTGKAKVRFQDWFEMKHKTHSTGLGSDRKWYGWSHRAVYGFKVGDKIKKGDVIYKGHEYTIKDAKQAAIDFADEVS